MSNLETCINDLKEELFNEECVKEYFSYKNIVDSNRELKELDEKMRFHQKEMCKNKDNEEIYYREKALYDELKNEFENNPILINYQIAKEEVFSLLVDIKQVLS